MRNNSKGSAAMMRETLIVILSECEESAAVVKKTVRCHPGNRFFTLCHRSVSLLSQTAFLSPFRMTIGGNGVIMRKTSGVIRSEREGSAAVVRKAVRCHPGNRFFTSFHCPISRFSHTVFLPPFRMTIGGKGVIMRGMLRVILNECEGSVFVVRKVVRR